MSHLIRKFWSNLWKYNFLILKIFLFKNVSIQNKLYHVKISPPFNYYCKFIGHKVTRRFCMSTKVSANNALTFDNCIILLHIQYIVSAASVADQLVLDVRTSFSNSESLPWSRINRFDRTSKLILFAKRESAFECIFLQFAKRFAEVF